MASLDGGWSRRSPQTAPWPRGVRPGPVSVLFCWFLSFFFFFFFCLCLHRMPQLWNAPISAWRVVTIRLRYVVNGHKRTKQTKRKEKKRSRRNCREWTWNEKRHDAESISTRLPTETAIERHLFWFRFCFDWFRCGGGGGGVGSWSGSRVFSSSVPNEIKIKTKNKHYRLNSVLVGFIDLLSFRWHFFRRLVAFQFFQYRWPKADCLPNIELETN